VSKGGMKGLDGKRIIDGRPEALLKDIDESLQRLQTDVIDLYNATTQTEIDTEEYQ